MTEEILPLDEDEVEKIAKEYVRRRENVEDVEVTGTDVIPLEELLVHIVDGKARRQTVDPTTWQAGVVEERPFSLKISDKDRKVISYKPDGWRKKNKEQARSESSEPGIIPPDEIFTDDDFRRDRNLKDSEIKRNEAEAEYYKKQTQGDSQKRDDNQLGKLIKRFGINTDRFKIHLD